MNADEMDTSEERDAPVGEWQDILGSGAVVKKVLTPGQGTCPEYKQNVLVHYQTRLAKDGSVVFNSREASEQPVALTIGDQTLDIVVPGLMLAIRMMKQGEVAEVKVSHRFAYADVGLKPHIGPNEDLEIRVELVQILEIEKEAVEMTPSELVEAVRKRKERGNDFFRMDLINKALRCYQEGIKMSESHLPPPPQDGSDDNAPLVPDEYNTNPHLLKLRAETAGNISNCLEKQEKWKECREACIAVLTIEPNNLKALLRGARVSLHMGDFTEAKACLERAKETHPNNPQIRKEFNRYKEVVQEYKDRKKAVYGGFLKPATSPAQSHSETESADSTPKVKATPEKIEPLPEPNSETKSTPATQPHSLLYRLIRVIILLAPTILAALVFLLLPQTVVAEPWHNINSDLAQKELSKIGYSTLGCEGYSQRASCCVCIQSLEQAQIRVERVREIHAGEMHGVKSFRFDENRKTKFIPYEESEFAVLSILEKICNNVPIDIPRKETDDRIPQVKVAIAKACTAMLDNHFDELLADILRNGMKDKTKPRQLCEKIVGVCEPRENWQTLVKELGPQYSSFTCKVCKQVASHLVKVRPSLLQLRNPASMCSTLQIAIPKSETRVEMVSRLVGDACISISYTNRRLIIQMLEDQLKFGNDMECTEELEQTLCSSECEPTGSTTI